MDFHAHSPVQYGAFAILEGQVAVVIFEVGGDAKVVAVQLQPERLYLIEKRFVSVDVGDVCHDYRFMSACGLKVYLIANGQ